MLRALALGLTLLVLAPSVWASRPSMEFSAREKLVHNHYVDFIVQRSAYCLQSTWDEHVAFHRKWGVSKFYGDRNTSLNTRAKRISALRAVGAPASLEPQLEGTSCIGLTRKCMAEAFAATENDEAKALWSRIDKFVLANGVGGIPLINALQGLGWTVMYWNPNPAMNSEWDKGDVARLKGKPVDFDSGVRDEETGEFIYHPGWGVHETRYNQVMRRNAYHTSIVDDKHTLVDFRRSVPESFQRAPFFVGVAHAGYHVFPGFYGRVIEAHSTRRLEAFDNLENSMFNPDAPGGGPRSNNSEIYRSGMIAVPPRTQR